MTSSRSRKTDVNRHRKNAFDKNAHNPGMLPHDDGQQVLLATPCKTGLDGLSGIETTDVKRVDYHYTMTIDERIEQNLQGVILPALEEFINDDLAALFTVGCHPGGRDLLSDEGAGIAGISTNPPDLAQGSGEYCLEAENGADDEVCDLVRGGLTVYAGDAPGGITDLQRTILEAIRAGMTPSTAQTNSPPFAREKAKYVNAHPAIVDIRFVEVGGFAATPLAARPPPTTSANSVDEGGRSPGWVIGILIAAAVVVALLIALAIYRTLRRKKEGDKGEQLKYNVNDFLDAEGSFPDDVDTIRTGPASPPPSPVRPARHPLYEAL